MMFLYRMSFLIEVYVIIYNFSVQFVFNTTFNNTPHMIPSISILNF